MRLTREAKFGLWLALAVVVGIAAFFAGGMLKPQESPYYVFDLSAPAYGSDLQALAAESPAGFTGFDDMVPGGSRTVLGGRIVDVTQTSLTLESPAGARTELRLADAPRLARLEPGSLDLLQPGTDVLVKLSDTEGVAAAVLVISQP
jgi:hypothetical protein